MQLCLKETSCSIVKKYEQEVILHLWNVWSKGECKQDIFYNRNINYSFILSEALCYEYAELHQAVCTCLFFIVCLVLATLIWAIHKGYKKGVITPVIARLSLPGRLILGLTTSRIPLWLSSKSAFGSHQLPLWWLPFQTTLPVCQETLSPLFPRQT